MKRMICGMILMSLLNVSIVSHNSFTVNGQVSASKHLSFILSLNVVFVGFQPELVNLALIDSNVQKNYEYFHENLTIRYNISVSYHFANSSYYAWLKTFCLVNSVNGTDTTSALNTTALEIQISSGQRMSIFTPRSGRAIDAAAVEKWLESNPCVTSPELSYTFYIINFTEFDTADHELEHWYNVTETDFEANCTRDFWRLEWDNALNPNVKFPYACFTSTSRIFFIDPSAFQWYLTWARMWWNPPINGPKYDYYSEDLDQFLATHDVSTHQGKTDLAYYLAGWIEDPINNLLAPDLDTSVEIANAHSVLIQVLFLNNASHLGYTNDMMSWICNSTMVEEAIADLAPFTDVKVDVEFRNLCDNPELKAIFDNAVIQEEDSWVYYDGWRLWNDLYALRESYFNLSAADIAVNGYVLLEKNISMAFDGKEFTGIGGSGQILVMKELGRYFQKDGISPKEGVVSALIHEAGHNLGFPHTFTDTKYAADFAFDVVGYYSYSYNFTLMRKDCFRRLVAGLIDRSSDLNKDGTVNILDISLVAAAYNTRPDDKKWNEIADLDRNEWINILDISAVAKDYGRTA